MFGADIPELLLSGRYDLALAPMTSYPQGFHSRTIRREPLCIAFSKTTHWRSVCFLGFPS